jgi:hypothetical protein
MEVSWDGLQLAPMGVEWDASEMFNELHQDEEVPELKSNDKTVSSDVTPSDPSFTLKSMSTVEDMDSHLDAIEKQLVSSIESNKLEVDPKYAVMDLRQPVPPTDTCHSVDAKVDISNPMSLGDYDTYDFGTSQVKAYALSMYGPTD